MGTYGQELPLASSVAVAPLAAVVVAPLAAVVVSLLSRGGGLGGFLVGADDDLVAGGVNFGFCFFPGVAPPNASGHPVWLIHP